MTDEKQLAMALQMSFSGPQNKETSHHGNKQQITMEIFNNNNAKYGLLL